MEPLAPPCFWRFPPPRVRFPPRVTMRAFSRRAAEEFLRSYHLRSGRLTPAEEAPPAACGERGAVRLRRSTATARATETTSPAPPERAMGRVPERAGLHQRARWQCAQSPKPRKFSRPLNIWLFFEALRPCSFCDRWVLNSRLYGSVELRSPNPSASVPRKNTFFSFFLKQL